MLIIYRFRHCFYIPCRSRVDSIYQQLKFVNSIPLVSRRELISFVQDQWRNFTRKGKQIQVLTPIDVPIQPKHRCQMYKLWSRKTSSTLMNLPSLPSHWPCKATWHFFITHACSPCFLACHLHFFWNVKKLLPLHQI